MTPLASAAAVFSLSSFLSIAPSSAFSLFLIASLSRLSLRSARFSSRFALLFSLSSSFLRLSWRRLAMSSSNLARSFSLSVIFSLIDFRSLSKSPRIPGILFRREYIPY